MKDKTTAALFALFLGWVGVHRFYLRQPGLGVLYIFLMFFGVSFILGLIDAVVFLAMDPREFDRRYNDKEGVREYDRYRNRHSRENYRATPRHRPPPRRTKRRPRRPSTEMHVPQRKRVNPYKQSGIKKYKDFDLEEAIKDFEKGLEIDPKDIALHFNIACAYSLTEQVDKAYEHLDKAVELGFEDFDKIKSHDDLAFVRIQPRFEEFEANGFRLRKAPQLESPREDLLQDDVLLSQLKRLTQLRDKGLITDQEYLAEKEKLMR